MIVMEKLVVVRGKTVEVNLVDENSGEVFVGLAHCSPNDKFDYQTGYEIANQRANIEKCATRVSDLRNRIEQAEAFIAQSKKEVDKLVKEFNSRIDKLAMDYDIVD